MPGIKLTVNGKTVEKTVEGRTLLVQLLREEQIRSVLAALATRGSSSRARSTNHLLSLREMATRSPALLWSLALAFDGDVEGGVRQLQG